MQSFSKSFLLPAYWFYAFSLSILLLIGNSLSAQNCLYRPTRLTAADPLCTKLTTLATRTNKAAPVTKLANASKVSNLSLDSIVTEMNLWALDSNRIDFLDDIMDVSSPLHLGNHVDSINVRMVRGWKMIYDTIGRRTIFKKDIQVLRSLDTILMTPTKWAEFTRNGNNISVFLSKYKETRCSLSGNVGLAGVPMMHEVLRNTAIIFERHQLTPGYLSFHDREVLASNATFRDTSDNGTITTTSVPSYGRDGAQHMIKYMVDSAYTRRVDSIDARIPTTGTGFSACKSDLSFRRGNGRIRFVEFKSYEVGSTLASAKNVEQLKCYLNQIDSMAEFRYVLNARKTTLDQARTKVQNMFQGTFGTAVFDVLWANTNLRAHLFPTLPNILTNKPIARQQFDNGITALDNRIFQIVEIN